MCSVISQDENCMYQSPTYGDGDLQDGRDYLHEFFHKEECLYSHQLFQHAAQVFDVLKHNTAQDDPLMGYNKTCSTSGNDQPRFPEIQFQSEKEKRLTFNLVFSALKYQKYLECMLQDCSFFRINPEFKDDHALVLVIVCDFKQRKFQKRTPLNSEQLIPYITEIEEALYRSKTKLNASLARSRIKARVSSLDHLLPDSVRYKDKLCSNMHLYCWVNQLKTELNTVLDTLNDEGFSMVREETQLCDNTYMLDHQCDDLIAFPNEQRQFIEDHPLLVEGHLVIQDKSSCIGPHSIRQLINEGDDILHVNIGSGLTTAHLASLTHNSESHIYAFGVQTEKQHNQVQHNLDRLGVKSRVKLINENIMQIDHSDDRLKHIKVVLLTAECSRSAVANPVNFIVSEGEDTSILKDLAQGLLDGGKLGTLITKHTSVLRHILRFPRVQGVVYYTRSMHEGENEAVVIRAIEYVNKIQQQKSPFRLCPPVIALDDKDIELENPLHGKYLVYPPSSLMSGCFVATIVREAEDPKEAAKDILARAVARGILTGVPVQHAERQRSRVKLVRKTSEKRRVKHANAPRRIKSTAVKDMSSSALVSNLMLSPHSHSMSNARITSVANPITDFASQQQLTRPKQALPVQAHNFPNIYVNSSTGEVVHGRSSSPNRLLDPLHANQQSPKSAVWKTDEPPHRQVIKHPAPFR